MSAAEPPEVALLLQRLIAHAVLYSHEVAQRLDLGSSDTQFLTLLQVHGPLSPGRLAELSGLTSGTVTGVVDRLERAGFVERRRAETDRRGVVVVPVEAALAERVHPEYQGYAEASSQAFAHRSAAEQEGILAFLRELLQEDKQGRPPRR
jgi:DNA-binding MarR family transcriptional regulator